MSSSVRTFAEQSVPRYTSYPTAPNFSAAVGSRDYALWLSELPTGTTLSLYLHVPFCTELCNYCGCHTKAVRRRQPVDAYADWLCEEIALVGAFCSASKTVHVHWGGGTPSLLGADRIAALTDRLRATFDLAGCEQAIELDPRYVTRELARALADLGIGRASLGGDRRGP